MPIAFVTDSTADIPQELAQAYPISIVPTILVFNGQNFEDGRGIGREEFYAQLPKMKALPTTAAPSAGSYMKAYEHLLGSGYDTVVSVHLSSILSGAINNARTGAQRFNGRVQHVDSEQLSMGIGYQVLAGAEAARQGASLEEVLSVMADTRARVRVFAMLSTLEYIHRSGRLSWAEANVGELLQLKPFVTLRNGAPSRYGEARTRKKGIQRLYKILAELGPLERLTILHTNPPDYAREMAAKFASQTIHPPMVVQATPIIGTHLGPNGLGFTAVVR